MDGSLEAAASPGLDLVPALNGVSAAWNRQDREGLERALDPLLGSPARLGAVLDRLTNGGLRDRPEAAQGAFLTLGTAVAFYHEPGVGARVPGADGPELVALLLARLPEVLEPERRQLAGWIARAESAHGRRIMNAAWLEAVLAGARAHPGSEDAWAALLEAIVAAPLGESDLDQLTQVLAFPLLHPELLRVALVGLLPSRSATILPWAEELAGADPNLVTALASSAAGHAPLDQALELLARLEGPTLGASFALLGEREGATEAAARRYDALVRAGLEPGLRRHLVTAMGADPDLLGGIAASDPDPAVRGQAWLGLSAFAAPSAELLGGLRAAYESAPGDPLHVPAEPLVLALDNLVRGARSELRIGALRLTQRIAAGSEDPAARARARALVGEFAAELAPPVPPPMGRGFPPEPRRPGQHGPPGPPGW